MFLDRKEGKKLHKGSVLVGYDLGEQYSQISYCTVSYTHLRAHET